MKGKNTRALVFGILISALALYFALRNVDLSTLSDSILSADPLWILAVLASYLVHYWLKAVRWRDLLEPVCRVRTAEAYPVMMTGFFANNFLPAHLGEFVRMYVGAKLFQVRKTEVLATIVLERILDFSVIALMFGGALIAGGDISRQLVYAGYVMISITVVAWGVIFVSLRFEQSAVKFFEWTLKPFPDRLGERMVNMFVLALTGMHSMKSIRLVISITALSLLQWALVGLAVYSALRSVGVDINMAGAVVTLAATVLAITLPAAPGFFGTIQLAFVLALSPYGVSENDALAGSVIFHLTSYAIVMILGLVALQQLNIRFADIRHGVDQP